ncbi:MAG: hypothetical protein QOH47_2609 [Sphingomonadales bacterium]|jgi:hypothetical protein|nr:hypothetical protein [Sphingomonadales bacterium]
MALRPSENTAGTWVPDPPLVAGAHALVVGISDYPFLSDGSAPVQQLAPNNGGLGQLEVSALSAARVFDWLKTTGEVAGAPLAGCRLLLAPRPDEEAEVRRLTGGHYAKADFSTLRAAIEAWGDDVFNGGPAEGPNVALFFYSGHGVEIDASPAILASDFLNPRSRGEGAGLAVAVEPMARAIKTYGVDRALFLVDACRDSSQLTRELDVVGESLLKPSRYPTRKPDGLITLRSTASGLKSYQLKTDPATLFCQAVLDALEGPPPSHIPYDTQTMPWQLLFSALEGHVKRKVAELLAGRSALAVQSVEADGTPYNQYMLVARKRAPEAGAPPLSRRGLDATATDTGAALVRAIDESARQVLRSADSVKPRDIDLARTGFAGEVGDLVHPGVMHAIFGHESISEPWVGSLRLLDAVSGEPVDHHPIQIVAAHKQESDDRMTAWIDLVVKPRDGHALWVATGGSEGWPSFAVVIPQDKYGAVPIRLDVAFEHHGDWQIADMTARLSDPAGIGDTPLSTAWQHLWEAQRTEIFGNLGAAGDVIDRTGILESIVRDKMSSPVAAAIATSYLLRCGRLNGLHTWPRNIADWFEWLPDGPVLWAETLMRRREEKCFDSAARQSRPSEPDLDDGATMQLCIDTPEYEEARRYFRIIAHRGAPYLATSMGMAIHQAAFWRKALERDLVPGEDSVEVAEACENIERAAGYFKSGGSFTRFAARDVMLGPDRVLGERLHAQVAAAYG